MLKTLSSKLSAVLLVLFCTLGLLFVVVMVLTTELHQRQINQRLHYDLAELLVADMELPKGRIAPDVLKQGFKRQMTLNPAIDIYLLDAQGRVQLSPGAVERDQVDLKPLLAFLNDRSKLPILGDDPRHVRHEKIFSVAPIQSDPAGGTPQGYLYVILGSEAQDSVAQMLRQNYILPLGLWVVGSGLLVAMMGGMLIFSLLTRRLGKLAAAMEAFQRDAAGNAAPIVNDGDEIDRLSKAFDQLSARIDSQMRALQQTDRMRQEFLANISHDLRTPLAALRGYLETLLLKEGSLTEQERHNYLEIATRQSERLTVLVARLFELVKLDARHVELNREAFQLGDLVADVAQKFELAAERNSVRLVTRVPDDDPFVIGDIGLIERVLENLIENALRYTPAGGRVELALMPRDGQVVLAVSDSGAGIADEDLPHIFDRFFRADKNRTGDGASAGLGLAIVKSILALHGARIEVASRRGEGTRFYFALPLASA